MKLLLDTNVFSNKKFLEWLKQQKTTAYMSSISYVELFYHFLKKGRDEEFMDAFLKATGVEILPFDLECAKITSKSSIGRWDFKEHARDYMIGSLALKHGGLLVTENIKDFEWMKKRVKSPDEFLKTI
ncbi:MAG: type II toxin-antitoxin system VapC family toxin [Candidatus Hydrothermarchaeales archaeon]